jgi:hypothetical protein
MNTSHIRKVSVLDDGCLAIFPESANASYQYIYREASGVYWDQERACFKSTPPKEWSLQKWYQQIVSVVSSGLGLQLILTGDTEYESNQEGFEKSIKLADQALRRYAHLQSRTRRSS